MKHSIKSFFYYVCIGLLFILTTGFNTERPSQHELSIRICATVPEGYVDLGLPSGTFWKSRNEAGFYNYSEAMRQFGQRVPSSKQWEELEEYCKWIWYGSGYTVVGPNGNSIKLPAVGDHYCDGNGNQGSLEDVGIFGNYCSSTAEGDFEAWTFSIHKNGFHSGGYGNCGQYGKHSVRLVY